MPPDPESHAKGDIAATEGLFADQGPDIDILGVGVMAAKLGQYKQEQQQPAGFSKKNMLFLQS